MPNRWWFWLNGEVSRSPSLIRMRHMYITHCKNSIQFLGFILLNPILVNEKKERRFRTKTRIDKRWKCFMCEYVAASIHRVHKAANIPSEMENEWTEWMKEQKGIIYCNEQGNYYRDFFLSHFILHTHITLIIRRFSKPRHSWEIESTRIERSEIRLKLKRWTVTEMNQQTVANRYIWTKAYMPQHSQ